MFSFISKTSREEAATPTPSEMNIESVSFDEEDNKSVRLGYHYKGTEEQIEEEKRKNALYEREADRPYQQARHRSDHWAHMLRHRDDTRILIRLRLTPFILRPLRLHRTPNSTFHGGREGNDENASHKDNKSVASATSNASKKSARSNKSPAPAVAAEPTLEAVHEDGTAISLEEVDDIPLDETVDTYTQKYDDVATGRSKKKRGVRGVLLGLTLVVGLAVGWYYDEECVHPDRRALKIEGDDEKKVPSVDMKRADDAVEASLEGASGVERRAAITIGHDRMVRYLESREL
ncbi:hypothetical protein THAOC_18736 [Thalassiosira oceanica]|uniref:Uncharacterized protein n=1 Tax=Thalassiosira oceanica TaxID=159749 RepID=K0SR97_THAOC|nr:hypothetical protein THAOC_18736 [Thalassiosira oceanica]|eukprot:EJK60852.1 hypothetical protein THAOC_18736 [Thalassiosira oceanica]